jgi:hypothetical protein
MVNLALFLKESTKEDKMYQCFMQKNAMASYIFTFESVQLLFVGCTETYSLFEQCTFIARKGRQYSKENLPILEDKVYCIS